MLLSLSLAVFAEQGGFVRSPSLNQAPVLVEYENYIEDCFAYIDVTAYADREELSEDLILLLEEAYDQVKENPDLSKLNEDIELSKFDEELKDIAKENHVEKIIVGIPINMDDSKGFQAQDCINFSQKISGFDIIFEDERLTSEEAEQRLRSRKIDFRRNKGLVDMESACIILEQYLSRK
jgi:putative Holliday junction resolvase